MSRVSDCTFDPALMPTPLRCARVARHNRTQIASTVRHSHRSTGMRRIRPWSRRLVSTRPSQFGTWRCATQCPTTRLRTALQCIAHDLFAFSWLQKSRAKTQLIAHDKEVYDVCFALKSKDLFASVGADGSVRMFDLRNLEHSSII